MAALKGKRVATLPDVTTINVWYDSTEQLHMRDKLLRVDAETVEVVTSQGTRRTLNRRLWERSAVRATEQTPYAPPKSKTKTKRR